MSNHYLLVLAVCATLLFPLLLLFVVASYRSLGVLYTLKTINFLYSVAIVVLLLLLNEFYDHARHGLRPSLSLRVPVTFSIWQWYVRPFDVSIDLLSCTFGVTTLVIAVFANAHTTYYLSSSDKRRPLFVVLLNLFVLAMYGLVHTANLISLLFF